MPAPPPPTPWEQLFDTSSDALLKASYQALHRVANVGVSNPHHYYFKDVDLAKLKARLAGYSGSDYPSLCIFRWADTEKSLFVHFCRRARPAAPLLDQTKSLCGIVVNAGFTEKFDDKVPLLRQLIETIVAHVEAKRTEYFGTGVTFPLEILISPSFHMPAILNDLLGHTLGYRVMPVDVFVVNETTYPIDKRAWREVIYHRHAIEKSSP